MFLSNLLNHRDDIRYPGTWFHFSDVEYCVIECHQAAIAEDCICRHQMVCAHAIQNGMSTRGIIADHAAHGGTFRRSRVWTKHQSMLCSCTIQMREDHPRIHDRRMGF